MDRRKALGLRLKELRKRKGLKQDKLAELVGLEPNSICNIETGKNYPSMQSLEKIIEVLEVTFTDVFKFEQHAEPEYLRDEINAILDKNPKILKNFYKIVKALAE